MMSREPQIRWSDAWLLTATYLASRQAPADLADILGAADLLNRAVPNPEELESGLFRLHERGWVTQVGEDLRFQPTAEAVEMIEELSSEKKSAYDIWKALEHRLGAISFTPGELLPHPDNSFSYPGFTPEVYREAVAQYMKRIRSRKRAP